MLVGAGWWRPLRETTGLVEAGQRRTPNVLNPLTLSVTPGDSTQRRIL